MSSILTKKISLFYLPVIAALSALVTILVTESLLSKTPSQQAVIENDCNIRIKRLGGHSLIKPILFVDNSCEADNLQLLKHDLNSIIAVRAAEGTLTSASVYLRKFMTGEWISINGSESYSPGSLMKIPILITYLKMNESHPGLLDKKFLNDQKYQGERKAVNVAGSIEPGMSYSVRELLKYMVVHSDNNATFLLNRNMDAEVFKRVFSDFGLPVPDIHSSIYPMNVTDYSFFLRALFNGTYLRGEDCEFALNLMNNREFSGGILKDLPADLRVAHKFGEEGTADQQQLHESALVYLDNSPYLLTIMTKGKDLSKQKTVLAEISSKVYQEFNGVRN